MATATVAFYDTLPPPVLDRRMKLCAMKQRHILMMPEGPEKDRAYTRSAIMEEELFQALLRRI